MRNERTKLFLKRNAECVVAYCVLAVVLAAALLSTMFKFLLPAVSSGFVIIISAVASATMGAALFPLRFEDEEEEA